MHELPDPPETDRDSGQHSNRDTEQIVTNRPVITDVPKCNSNIDEYPDSVNNVRCDSGGPPIMWTITNSAASVRHQCVSWSQMPLLHPLSMHTSLPR